jgi:hypothetical protein
MDDLEDRAADDAARYWALRAALRAYEPYEGDYLHGLERELSMLERCAAALRAVIAHEAAMTV